MVEKMFSVNGKINKSSSSKWSAYFGTKLWIRSLNIFLTQIFRNALFFEMLRTQGII